MDPLTDTVTALADGEARIFAESFDQASYDVCIVTVGSTAKDASVMKSGGDFLELSPSDKKKISAETLTRYLDFLSGSTMDEIAYENASSRLFDVIAAVKPGTEEVQSQLAKNCGVDDAEALKELNAITLTGTLESILQYAKDDEDLQEIFELGPFYIEEPVENGNDSVVKAVGLQGEVEALTSVSFAHNIGLNGRGRWIAVIDSGINYRNAQFSGNRQIVEACFSKAKSFSSYSVRSVCRDGSTGVQGASAPTLAWRANAFNHGSHVTGIAAGTGGIAPLANIISIQSHTEKVWTCKNATERKDYSCGSSHGNQCCKSYISDSDLARSYDYILTLAKQPAYKNKIDAVNMSYGTNAKYASVCDTQNKFEKNYFDKFRAAGMLPIVSSGNNGFDGGINSPACLSNAYTVGNLSNQKSPALRKTSNHSPKVDIAAPGPQIYSAGYSQSMMYMSGTSMAAPMVSGAIALIKQMYPGMTPDDLGVFLKDISQKTVNSRVTGKRFNYTKPVLTFGRIHWLFVPYYSWVIGGNQSITIKVYRMARSNVKYSAEVSTLSGQKISGLSVQQKDDGDFTSIRVSGPGLQNNQIYKVMLKRSFSVNGKNHWATRAVYGRPTGDAQAPAVSAEDKGVTLTSSAGGVRYSVYDVASGTLVKQVTVNDGSTPYKITGLVNGRMYAVTGAPYRSINITKNGKSQAAKFYGTDSRRQIFVPMSSPFNPKVGYPVGGKNSSTVSCTADNAATGIIVKYRKANSADAWTDGCTTTGKKFSCTVPVGRGYDFQIQKYIENGGRFVGPAATVKGR